MPISLKNEFNNAICEEYKVAIKEAFDLALKKNVKIYLIGGIVRDLILANEIKDVDIAVQGDAVSLTNDFEAIGCEILNVQENLRTIKVKFPNGAVIDFASTREEKYTQSGVLPVAYNFGCALEKDIKRRDFTINTLAINENYFLIDYCGGYEDILNKKIRILHDNSFIDDPSRIIRALKFKERLCFELEENTAVLMKNYLVQINNNMPLERIKSELRQYFEIEKPNLYSNLIKSGAYKLVSDNPVEKIYDDDNLTACLYDLKEKWYIYIALLIVKSDYAIDRLNLTTNEKRVIKEVRELLQKEVPKTKIGIYNLFNNLMGLSVALYYMISANPQVEEFLTSLKDVNVLISGKDLIELGFTPSPYFNELFDLILKEKLEGRLKTKKEELCFVKQFIKKGE